MAFGPCSGHVRCIRETQGQVSVPLTLAAAAELCSLKRCRSVIKRNSYIHNRFNILRIRFLLRYDILMLQKHLQDDILRLSDAT